MFYFFFKQKTAYDMRISDWSSDVCSSDLIIQSVPVWQLHILDQNGRGKATQQLATLGNRACGFHLVAAPAQRFSDDSADRLIVIHHQYASLGGHFYPNVMGSNIRKMLRPFSLSREY